MGDPQTPVSEQALARAIGVSEQAIERRRAVVGLVADDYTRIASIRDIVVEHLGAMTSSFFDFLSGFEEGRPLLSTREIEEQARALIREHLAAMVAGEYDTAYVEQLLRLGALYGRAGIEPRVFLGAFHQLMRAVGAQVMKRHPGGPNVAFEAFMSLKKVAFLDIGVVVDVLTTERERTIRQQAEAIRELSTPVLQIRERLLLLPIIGLIDTHRAQLITDNLLRAIRVNRARVVVMDVTGVVTIDSKVANHLLQTVTAAKLMGATVIITGLSEGVAQSLVALGIDLSKMKTIGDLQGGLEEAERLLGMRMVVDPYTAAPAPAAPAGA
jgi:rsbT co-antagonist protein RsbR